jgi:large subunit ribosomal protein L10
MTLRMKDKEQIVSHITEVAEGSMALVAADYSGLSVSQVEKLRKGGKQDGVYVKVVRNTLARRALGATSFEPITKELTGPMILAFAQDEPGAAAKLIAKFQKDHDSLEVKAMVVDGELLPASDLKKVAAMPTRDEALSMLAGTMLAPVTGVARTANEVIASLARVLDAYAEKNQEAA